MKKEIAERLFYYVYIIMIYFIYYIFVLCWINATATKWDNRILVVKSMFFFLFNVCPYISLEMNIFHGHFDSQ